MSARRTDRFITGSQINRALFCRIAQGNNTAGNGYRDFSALFADIKFSSDNRYLPPVCLNDEWPPGIGFHLKKSITPDKRDAPVCLLVSDVGLTVSVEKDPAASGNIMDLLSDVVASVRLSISSAGN